MRHRQAGWRSARPVPAPPPRADFAPGRAVVTPGAAPATTGRGRRRVRLANAASAFRASPFVAALTPQWSVSFVALLAYTYAAVTYGLPLVTPAMVVAVIALPLERERPVVPVFLIVFALFVAWAGAGYSSSYDTAGTVDQTTVLAKVLLITFVTANVIRQPWRLRMFMIFFLACFATYPTRGTLVNYFVVGYTKFGRALWNYIYSNSNDLAALTFFPLALSVAVALTEKKGWIRTAALVGMAVLPLVILLTQSRGALIALVVTGLMFFVSQSRGKRVRSLLTAAAVAIMIIPFVPKSAWDRFSLMKNLTSTSTIVEADPEGSAEARYNIWRVATTIIKSHPISGIGLGAYPRAHAAFAPRVGVPDAALGLRDTHSTYLNVAAETGIPGLLLFLTVLGVVVVPCERTRRRAKGTPRATQLLALELGLLAFLLAGVFGSFAKLSFLYIQLAVMWALTTVTNRELVAAAPPTMRSSPASHAPRTGLTPD